MLQSPIHLFPSGFGLPEVYIVLPNSVINDSEASRNCVVSIASLFALSTETSANDFLIVSKKLAAMLIGFCRRMESQVVAEGIYYGVPPPSIVSHPETQLNDLQYIGP